MYWVYGVIFKGMRGMTVLRVLIDMNAIILLVMVLMEVEMLTFFVRHS